MLALVPVIHAEPSPNELFNKANTSLAQGNAQEALDTYLKIADTQGTSSTLAANIAVAAENANQPGIAEWAKTTRQLRLAEWAIIGTAIAAILWAASIAYGVWKQKKARYYIIATLLASIAIGSGIWTTQHYLPADHDAIITTPTDATILISPFEGADPITTLPAGTHVQLLPNQHSSGTGDSPNTQQVYSRITHPATQTTGWILKKNLRPISKQ